MTTFYVQPFVLPYIPTDSEDMDWSISNLNLEEEGHGVPCETPASTPAPDLDVHFDKNTPIPVIAEHFRSTGDYAKKGGKLFEYQDGKYVVGEDSVNLRMTYLLGNAWTSNKVESVKKYLLAKAEYLEDKPDPNLINVLNGIYDLSEQKLLPHTPKLLTTIQLPVVYDSTKGCPNIDKFINEVFPADAVTFAFEWIGYLLTADSTMHVALLLVGDGRNGKSTFLKLCQYILGKDNYTSVPINLTKAFQLAIMYGKLANISSDLPPKRVLDTDILKQMIAGDSVHAEYKNKDGFTYEPFIRFMFACNEIPASDDRSDGFKERFKVVPFSNSFITNPDPYLLSKLTTPGELSGLLNKALEAWSKAKAIGAFSKSVALDKGKQLFAEAIDHVQIFLSENTISGDDFKAVKKDLFLVYQNWCKNVNFSKPYTRNNFNKQIVKKYRQVHDGKTNKDYWKGIGLLASAEQELLYEEHSK